MKTAPVVAGSEARGVPAAIAASCNNSKWVDQRQALGRRWYRSLVAITSGREDNHGIIHSWMKHQEVKVNEGSCGGGCHKLTEAGRTGLCFLTEW